MLLRHGFPLFTDYVCISYYLYRIKPFRPMVIWLFLHALIYCIIVYNHYYDFLLWAAVLQLAIPVYFDAKGMRASMLKT